jgi:large subunit ribosomal protein L25
MDKLTIEATPRGTGRHNNREVREASRVPAVVYGKGQEALAVSMDRKLLGIALHKAGGRPIEMSIEGGPTLHVLAREIQRHQTKHNILHVDFMSVSMTEKVRVSVPVMAEGHPPAVTASGDLVLVRSLDAVEVECLPGDIPEHILADMSTLQTVHDEIRVGELKAAQGVKVLNDPEQVVFAITMSRAAAVEEALEGAPSAEDVEVVKKGKKDEDEA